MATCEHCETVRFFRAEMAYTVKEMWCRLHEQAEHDAETS